MCCCPGVVGVHTEGVAHGQAVEVDTEPRCRGQALRVVEACESVVVAEGGDRALRREDKINIGVWF